jgi:2-keto-4-pentenoate hydratase/2-oxohepta-3-ene-1,7-dioic acid hydratase in catechol pathway
MMMGIEAADIFTKRAVVRLATGGRVRYGLWEDGAIRLFEGSPFAGGKPGRKNVRADKARLLAPCRPSKVVAVGLNYRSHAQEMGVSLPAEPMLFIKPSTAVIGPGAPIALPEMSRRVDYEAELGVVMGRTCRGVTPEAAPDYILGYTCLNDVTARDLQAADVQYTRAKGFDTFCPIGPAVALDVDPRDLRVRCRLNGRVRQDGRTSDLAWSAAELTSFISRVMTLHPGDVIATGTPSGIGPVSPGDTVVIEVSGIGRLVNPVGG